MARQQPADGPNRIAFSSSLSALGKRNADRQGVPSRSVDAPPAIPASGCAFMKRTSSVSAPGSTIVSGLSNHVSAGKRVASPACQWRIASLLP